MVSTNKMIPAARKGMPPTTSMPIQITSKIAMAPPSSNSCGNMPDVNNTSTESCRLVDMPKSKILPPSCATNCGIAISIPKR
mmetsp:Transcript_10874/g.16135  ORF Transcript_10874/g.16135 Transcript_10874/m.16135 type:complete len:82 (-) Transcript_10874:193-438(-)